MVRTDTYAAGRRAGGIPLALLLALLTGCGLTDPLPDPDEPLPVRALVPSSLVSGVEAHITPDSAGTPVTEMRFTVPLDARAAMEAGVRMEAVMRVPAGRVVLEAYDHDAGAWVELADEQAAGSDEVDWWWRGGWMDTGLSAPLTAADGTVRLRITPGAQPGSIALRAFETPPGLGLVAGRGALAAAGGDLAVLDGTDLRILSSSGSELEALTTANPPASFCRLGTYYFGVTATEVLRVPVSGGSWSRVSLLPWDAHGGVSITSDGTDLYLLRHPAPSGSDAFPQLYRVHPSFEPAGSFNFEAATLDEQEVRRNGLTGGMGAAMLWDADRRVFAASGSQEGRVGLVTFSKAGRALEFIPLPFNEADLRAAVSDGFLFVSGRPTLEAVAWSGGFQPDSPAPGILFRWSAP